MLSTLSSAISKAAAAKAAAETAAAAEASHKKDKVKKEREPVVPRALPSRHARSAAAEQIRKTSTAAAKGKEDAAAPTATTSMDHNEGSGRWCQSFCDGCNGCASVSARMFHQSCLKC